MFSESVVHKKCPHSIYSINIFQLGKTGGKREFLCCIFGFVPLLLLDQSDHLMVPPYGTLVFPVFFFFLRYQPATRKPPTALSTCIIELYCFAAGMGLSNARTRLIRVALAEKRRGIRSGDGSNNSTNSDRLTGVGLDTGWTAGGAAGGGLVFLLRNPVVSNALELLWWRNMK